MAVKRNWDILIIGGASGSGKTSISLPLARHYGVDLVRVDDFQMLLKAMTTPKTLPPLHYWDTHPNYRDEGVDAAVLRLIDVGLAMMPGLKAVVDDHMLENIPMVLEGDFILPEFCASWGDKKVKSLFIHEPEREQILHNYLTREGELQEFRADVSHAYGAWLKESCRKYGISVIEARPWGSLMERVLCVLNNKAGAV